MGHPAEPRGHAHLHQNREPSPTPYYHSDRGRDPHRRHALVQQQGHDQPNGAGRHHPTRPNHPTRLNSLPDGPMAVSRYSENRNGRPTHSPGQFPQQEHLEHHYHLVLIGGTILPYT